MGDRYASFAHSGPGRALVRRFGLPEPPRLHRYTPGDPLLSGPALISTATGGRVTSMISQVLSAAGVERVAPAAPVPAQANGGRPDRPRLHAALIFDATGVTDVESLRGLHDFFRTHLSSLYPNGRVLVLGLPPAAADGIGAAAAQEALTGFTRSLAKELGRGSTAHLVQVTPGAEENLAGTLRFLLSSRSAYLSGQVLHLQPAQVTTPADWHRPLAGKVALVTGAAGGIGAATAEVLARDGAELVCADQPGHGDSLAAVANRVGGTALQLDLADPAAAQRINEHLAGQYGQVDIVVHNAGITRDRQLATLSGTDWQAVLELDLAAVVRITEGLLDDGLVPEQGRIVMVSSLAGLAGKAGQTHYAAAKAGLIGLARAWAPALQPREVTANAVVPGFIDTPLTAQLPKVPREFGRRMNSLSQAGRPGDVAEAIAWLASPGSAGVTGQVVRVCGQSIIGA
ncbi:3-oxoacyl-ACP reductase [Natronosporangium hydrolyticum]|uniref:3-oxoacyl-ACP reductase n=1 Tax=Natronosporangium hydrolyticum TaxID=2811111 RepID=A0A895YJ90_9ACTN|nr:3-oxoacyl-ACP reductase [Natronosporangium hydrolyticum]QSB14666.1 3-oxoacyl-ACP reductase [Natronosporangium hydrolyticum]